MLAAPLEDVHSYHSDLLDYLTTARTNLLQYANSTILVDSAARL
jgi:hypothetical protein